MAAQFSALQQRPTPTHAIARAILKGLGAIESVMDIVDQEREVHDLERNSPWPKACRQASRTKSWCPTKAHRMATRKKALEDILGKGYEVQLPSAPHRTCRRFSAPSHVLTPMRRGTNQRGQQIALVGSKRGWQKHQVGRVTKITRAVARIKLDCVFMRPTKARSKSATRTWPPWTCAGTANAWRLCRKRSSCLEEI